MIDLDLYRSITQWEVRREVRSALENQFKDYTGHIDLVELHIPYTHYDFIRLMLDRASHKKGNKILISAGDSVNFDIFSHFWDTSTDDPDAEAELKRLIKVLKEAEKVYDKIIFISTNHEHRLDKILNKTLGKQKASAVRPFIKTFNNYFKENNLTKIAFVDGYFMQIGDSIISHMEDNSSTNGKTRSDLIAYFKPRIHKPLRVIYGAHTHCQGEDLLERIKVIEIGCIAETMDYWRSGKMNGKRKMSSIGYGEGYMEKGVSDLNKCHSVFCGWEGYLG